MSNLSSKYKTQILKLREEGKKYKEIVEILGCSMSGISYHLSNKQQERARLTRIKNTESRKDSRKNSVYRNRKYVDDYLKNHSCVDCGNSDVRVLEFDHVRGNKETNVSNVIRNGWKLERLISEIEKCEIRCCNCHRIITIERRKHKLNINQVK
jgi:hypothetical protein